MTRDGITGQIFLALTWRYFFFFFAGFAAAFFMGFAATGLGIDFEFVRPEIETSEDAARAVDSVFAGVDSLIAGASDESLILEAPVGDGQIAYASTKGIEVKKNVEGALRMIALHTADHAQQIAGGSGN